MQRLFARRGDERGTILVLAAVGMVLAMISAGLAVDLGTLAQEARRNQRVADLAALDAARVSPANYTAAALASAARNSFPTGAGYSVTPVEGVKVNGQCQAQAGSGTVCVTVTSPHRNAFPFIGGARTTSRAGMAGAANPIGTVRVGSTLASASGSLSGMQVLMLNRVMSGLVGGTYSTDAVGWQGLASGGVTFGALTSALATATGNSTFNVGTTDQVLSSTFTAAQLFAATASALRNDGNAADVSVANSVENIGASASGTALSAPLKLYDLFDFGSVVVGNKQDVANATLNVLDLIRGGAILADGNHLASFNLTAADVLGALNAVIPGGFSSVKVTMGLIEAPQQSFPGPPGKDAGGNYYTSAETSQIRVKLDVNLKIPLTQPIKVAGLTVLNIGSLIDTNISYYLSAGTGHAYLDALHCGTSADPTTVDILGKTDVGTSSVGLVTDANLGLRSSVPVPTTETVVSVLGLLNIKTTGVVSTTFGGNPGTTLTFVPPYTTSSASQKVTGGPIKLPSLADANLTVDPLVALLDTGTLVSSLVSGINSTGLTFNTSTVGLDTTIVKPLYDAIGLSFGDADVWAPPVQTCAALSPLSVSAPSDSPPVLKG